VSKPLSDRLAQGKIDLNKAYGLLAKHPALLSTEVGDSLRALAAQSAEIDRWLEMLEARAIARQFLDGLENRADRNGDVPLGTQNAKYQHVRLIGVQAYETMNWALADSITKIVGRVLCTRAEEFRCQLLSHFVHDDRKDTTAAALFDSVKKTFGWPLGISYVIRNHFVHDGGQLAGTDFFEGPSPQSAFRISEAGWRHVERTAQAKYGVDSLHQRPGASLPNSPRDDLRVVLTSCEREMDDALGILLGSACSSLLSHIGFMVGED